MEIINPTIQKANRSLEALMKHDVDLAEAAHVKSQKSYTMFRNVIVGSILLALVCGFGPVL